MDGVRELRRELRAELRDELRGVQILPQLRPPHVHQVRRLAVRRHQLRLRELRARRRPQHAVGDPRAVVPRRVQRVRPAGGALDGRLARDALRLRLFLADLELVDELRAAREGRR